MFQKKTWTDREVEHPGGRLIEFTDGSREPAAIYRNEGEIYKEGDALNASSFNDLENRIDSAFEQLNKNDVLDAHLSDEAIHLSTAEKEKIQAIDHKVDRVSGKGLSANDFTDEDKAKLDSLPSDFSAAQTQSDWNENKSDSGAYIKNKPDSLPASDVYDWAKQPDKPIYTASEVGADAIGSAAASLSNAKKYTDEKTAAYDSHTGNESIHVTTTEKEKLRDIMQKEDLLKAVYPVGSIYLSVNPTNPETLFGGTWTAWGAGRVPVGVNTANTNFNTVEKTGGSSAVTLSSSHMPAHTHSFTPKGTISQHSHTPSVTGYFLTMNASTGTSRYNVKSGTGTERENLLSCPQPVARTQTTNTVSTTFTGTAATTESSGSGTAHTNLQPYITCYMWKRTA